MSTSLRLSFAKIRGNFRWADLVQGTCKEWKNAHSASTGAFRWPSASTRNLLHRIRRKAGPSPEGLGPSCTFGGKQAQTATLLRWNDSHTGSGCASGRRIRPNGIGATGLSLLLLLTRLTGHR